MLTILKYNKIHLSQHRKKLFSYSRSYDLWKFLFSDTLYIWVFPGRTIAIDILKLGLDRSYKCSHVLAFHID